MENSPAYSSNNFTGLEKLSENLHLPINPSHQRSSLTFSRVVSEACPEEKYANDNLLALPESGKMLGHVPSNIGRKRIPSPRACSNSIPNDSLPLERLVQNANATLHRDMCFASSPVGSIASRFPMNQNENENPKTPMILDLDKKRGDSIPAKEWRYSFAPQSFTEVEIDVREPFPITSPGLPPQVDADISETITEIAEPLSSGFTSPVGQQAQQEEIPSELASISQRNSASPESFDHVDTFIPENGSSRKSIAKNLEQPLTSLKVSHAQPSIIFEMEDSPNVSHLKRLSRDNQTNVLTVSKIDEEEEEMFLSTPARNAAEFAQGRHESLKEILAEEEKQDTSKAQTPCLSDLNKGRPIGSPCSDQRFHEERSLTMDSDPVAYNKVSIPKVLYGPGFQLSRSECSSSPLRAFLRPCMPSFHRVNSRGSPMPYSKHNERPMGKGRDDRLSGYQTQSPFQPSAHHHSPHDLPVSDKSSCMAMSEHFQPGWYYTEITMPIENNGPLNYSFSTAASKMTGRSSAPDSQIRDSYRTDTLTPLAKPPNRFRKTGIGALASLNNNLGDSKPEYIDGSRTMPIRPRKKRTWDSPEPLDFRTSTRDLVSHHGLKNQHKKRDRRPLEPNFQIAEDEYSDVEARDQALMRKAEDGFIHFDGNTKTPEKTSSTVPQSSDNTQKEVLKELGPNVTPWRKGMTRSNKKRRPSYWDGDLEEVRNSPAARRVRQGAERHVTTSPLKNDIEIGQEAEMDFEEQYSNEGQEMESFLDAKEEMSDVSGNENESLIRPDVETNTMCQ